MYSLRRTAVSLSLLTVGTIASLALAGGADPLSAGRRSPLSPAELRTTTGAIALANLQGQIEGEEHLGIYGPLTVKQRAGIIELIGMRGQFLGSIADYEQAEALANQLVRERPADGASYVARAKTRATFHRFPEALADLDEAERLGVPRARNDKPRAAILQATGRYDEALAIRRAAAEIRPDIASLAAEATVYADRGDVDAAERLFVEAQYHYRDVSPFPVAWLYFQQGLMWMREGDLERARGLFAAAHERCPEYAAAQGHLAEVEAALGDREHAIALLRPLAQAADDPDYAAQLARIYTDAGRPEEARPWRAAAARRYDELVARHPEAFADHAAEFWLYAGGDPAKASALAERNLANRSTPRAYELALQTAVAAGDAPTACDLASHTQALPHQWPQLRALTTQTLARCSALGG
jgi:tetratricopeptide (TPR) repeat protein